MEINGAPRQSPRSLHKMRIPSYARASEGYPLVAKSAKAAILEIMNNSCIVYAFIHVQSPCLHAEVHFGTQAWFSA
ncbi:MAG: hypothetical protein H6Q41_1986 [Deltaproteobacteria bacterium]|nr:hypothetical protein [Deltaproteobacteria bacterium]